MAHRAYRTILLVSAAALLGAPGLAFAADAPADDQGTAVEEVIVTAQKREERLQDVPAAVSAFKADQLERMGIDGSKQLSQVTPGLNFTQSVFSPQPTIRGIGVRGVGAGDESVVPIYVDGAYQSFIAGADLQFNNIERIEVLKGPQGALFGRNATGGAINIITKEPTADPHGAFSLSYGRYNEWIGKGYVSGGTDKLAGDIAIVARRDDGYIRDNVRGDTYGAMNDVSIRAKLVFHPGENIDVKLAAGYTNNVDSTGEAYRPYNGDTTGRRVPGNTIATTAYTSALSYHPYNKLAQYTLSGTVVFHLDNMDLTMLSGLQDNALRIKADSDGTPQEIATLTYRQVSRNQYNEIYAVSKGDGQFSWVIGAVYYHDVSGMEPYSQTFSRSVSLGGVVGAQVETRTHPRIVTNSYAAYAQGTYRFNDQWSATVGGRYTTESKDFNTEVGVVPVALPARSATFSQFTPNLVIQYQPSHNYNFYFKGGQAFKSGIFNASATTVAATAPVNPETVTQYELGMKSDLSSQVRLNVSAYYTDYKDLQSNTRDPITLSSGLQNAGGAKISGFELEVYYRPIDRMNLRFGLAGLKGTYNNFPAAQVYYPISLGDPVFNPATPEQACQTYAGVQPGGNRAAFCNANGKKIVRTPFLTANLGGDYTVPTEQGDFIFSGNIYYQGKSYWDVANRLEEKAHTLVNAQVEWRLPGDQFSVALWGDNLLDTEYSLTLLTSPTADSQVLARPRTYGLEVKYRW
ncbi:MAG: TonB-dependent receptor [Caulobacter sp.]|nr:TonB-dependent receptor [Caulobacter sp.]